MKTTRQKSQKKRPLACLILIATMFVGSAGIADDNSSSQDRKKAANQKIRLIYDGDLGPDPCDFSTLSMLHEYHKKKWIDLVGVVGATPDPYLASTLSIYNRRYGDKIPFGAFQEGSDGDPFSAEVKKMYSQAIAYTCYSNQNKVIYEKFANKATKSLKDVPSAVEIYRQLLSRGADNSITIYAAGPLFNFPPLFQSPADRHSSLKGTDLLKRKVKQFVIMGGSFPNSADNPTYAPTDNAEYNWWALRERNTTKTVLETLVKIGKPMTYVGAEQGPKILVGRKIAQRLGRDHPTTQAYYLYRRTAEVPKDSKQKAPKLTKDNPAYDEIALFYAVEGGVGDYFSRVRGRVQVDKNGANTWIASDGNESYITILPAAEERLRKVIIDRITGKF